MAGSTRPRPAKAPRSGGILRYFQPLPTASADVRDAGRPSQQVTAAQAHVPANLEGEEASVTLAPSRVSPFQQQESLNSDGAAIRATATTSHAQPSSPRSDAPVIAPVSEYERKRRQRMALNASFLRQLGIQQSKDDVARGQRQPSVGKPKKRAAKPVQWHQPAAPVRRSKRLRAEPEDTSGANSVRDGAENVTREEAASKWAEEIVYDDSSVYRYVVQSSNDTFTGSGLATDTSPSKSGERWLRGFIRRSDANVLEDAKLKKIYAVSFTDMSGSVSSTPGLVAVGGHGGHVSIYPAPKARGSTDKPANTRDPLMSFKAHSGWVSSLNLVSHGSHSNLLLTASNDALVKLWDLHRCEQRATGAAARLVSTASNLHTSGIFTMDVREDAIVTGSKDASIVVASLRGDSASVLEVVHRFAVHDGVVKSVKFAPLNACQVASGGNDRVLRVLDTRTPAKAAVAIEDAHHRAINSVEWHPTQEHQIMSAGFDPEIHLFDLRRSSTPLFTFTGHYMDARKSAIYHPLFVHGGRNIVAAAGSQCRELSLYDTLTGSTISRGDIGMRPDYLATAPRSNSGGPLMVASGAQLHFYDFDWTAIEHFEQD